MILSERLIKLHQDIVGWYNWLYYVPKETWPHEVIKSLPFNLTMFPPHELEPIFREVITGMVEWAKALPEDQRPKPMIEVSKELLKQTAPPKI